MAYEELLTWSGNRAAWQQDALRRLAQFGELSEDDISELRLQIEDEAGLPTEEVPEPVLLTEDHLTEAATNPDAVPSLR